MAYTQKLKGHAHRQTISCVLYVPFTWLGLLLQNCVKMLAGFPLSSKNNTSTSQPSTQCWEVPQSHCTAKNISGVQKKTASQ
jgi:hypothetical protein